MSLKYSCTTSSPVTAPVFSTLTLTSMEPDPSTVVSLSITSL
ncbi:hypothetical protein ACPPVW_04380 [Leifsonia sp. McL0607]